MSRIGSVYIIILFFLAGCSKSSGDGGSSVVTPPANFSVSTYSIDGITPLSVSYDISIKPVIKFQFSTSVNKQSATSAVTLTEYNSGASVNCNVSYERGDSVVILQPVANLNYLTKYNASVTTALKSAAGGSLTSATAFAFFTKIDSTDKFAQISDTALLTLVQRQTFKYFWDFGHPVSGLARERNTSGDVVTSGGSGFGIMSILVAVNRGFISRTDALNRLTTITNFLTTKCQRWHGAFSHWINGATGATVPFGNNNGADIVETSYLLEGLLCARQFFNTSDMNERSLRDSINSIWNAVDWNWFTQNSTQKSVYWQYNPSYTATGDIWSIAVTGWNEALITYVLAASSTTHSITKEVYDIGWARNGAIKNGNTYYGVMLPLGEANGGPMFFSHYSFLGINPNALTDVYANYQTQTLAHAQINYNYCVANPKQYFGYSNLCWGLTASDIASGYTASSPNNDVGVIAPTAAIASMPYTPALSMNALKFFYYKLGDKLWGDYGFYDAFNLSTPWFASSTLAIDQGPIICMIENYRSQLLWNLFMSCPEIKTGMKNIGFSSPNL
jgi:hypothetical protein